MLTFGMLLSADMREIRLAPITFPVTRASGLPLHMALVLVQHFLWQVNLQTAREINEQKQKCREREITTKPTKLYAAFSSFLRCYFYYHFYLGVVQAGM